MLASQHNYKSVDTNLCDFIDVIKDGPLLFCNHETHTACNPFVCHQQALLRANQYILECSKT